MLNRISHISIQVLVSAISMETLIHFHMFEVLGLTPSREEIPQKTKPFHVLVKIFFLAGLGSYHQKQQAQLGPLTWPKPPRSTAQNGASWSWARSGLRRVISGDQCDLAMCFSPVFPCFSPRNCNSFRLLCSLEDARQGIDQKMSFPNWSILMWMN